MSISASIVAAICCCRVCLCAVILGLSVAGRVWIFAVHSLVLPKFVWGVHNGDFGHLHRCVDGPGGDCGRSLWRGSGYILQRALPSWAEEPRRGRGSVQRGVGQHPLLAAKRPGTCCTKIK